jgi:hypothetical protein
MWHLWGGGGQKFIQESEPEGKRPLGRYKNRWEDDIKVDVKETGSDDMIRIC